MTDVEPALVGGDPPEEGGAAVGIAASASSWIAARTPWPKGRSDDDDGRAQAVEGNENEGASPEDAGQGKEGEEEGGDGSKRPGEVENLLEERRTSVDPDGEGAARAVVGGGFLGSLLCRGKSAGGLDADEPRRFFTEVEAEGLIASQGDAGLVPAAGDDATTPVEPAVQEIMNFCSSEELGLDALRDRVVQLPPDCEGTPFLQRICANKKVTVEIAQYLLATFPEAANGGGEAKAKAAPPLHAACRSADCPTDVIEVLLEANSTALRVMHAVEGGGGKMEGLPLHHYLTRGSRIDLSTVRMLVAAYPRGLMEGDGTLRYTPLHALVANPRAGDALDVVTFLVETKPSALRQRDNFGNLPVHTLCGNKDLDEAASLAILSLLLRTDPATASEENDFGYLPLHLAARGRPPDFCRALVDVRPASLEATSHRGSLPLHEALGGGRLDTLEYLIEAFPDGLAASTGGGMLAIHEASRGESNVEIVRFLLKKDPEGASKANDEGELPFHLACASGSATVEAARTLYDAFPEAILRSGTPEPGAVQASNPDLADFLEDQTRRAREALLFDAMHKFDAEGRLPLHRALRDGVPLGTVKLLLKGNSSAIRAANYDGVFPMHVACEFCGADVVGHLAEINARCLEDRDVYGNSALHFACRGGNLGAVEYLLGRRLSAFAGRNGDGKFPSHLLYEHGKKAGLEEDAEHVEALRRLCQAYPQTVQE